MSMKNWSILLIAAVVLLFVYNGEMHITDSVESNYALTAKEMVQSGDWVSPQIYGKYWFDKPVFFYWVTAIGYKIFGFNEFAARFFPAVFGLFSLGLIAWSGRKLYSEKVAFWSTAVLLTSFSFFLISKSVITDSSLFFFLSAALLCWLLGYEKDKRYYYGTYLFCALATLTKGPIGLLLPGLIIVVFLCFEKNWAALKTMKLVSGSLLFLLITLPWYGAMYALHTTDFLNVFLGTHNFLRATVSEHPRDNVIYYYTLVLLLGFFPWSGFLPLLLKKLFRSDRRWVRPPSRELFLITWAVVIFVFFQCMATKYITYTYPLLFPLSLLMGKYIKEIGSEGKIFLPIGVQALFYIMLISGSVWAGSQGLVQNIEFSLLLPALAAALVATCLLLYARKTQKVFLFMACIAIAMNLILLKTVCVPLTQERSAKDIAIKVKQDYSDKNIYAYGNYSASAVFYSDKRICLLIEDEKEEYFRPKAYSWSSKNIMPYEKLSQLDTSGETVILMKKRYNESFTEKTSDLWQVEELGKWNIVKYE